MMAILIAAAATVAASPPPPAPLPALHRGEARSVMESQLATPPRTSADAGLDPDEADAVYRRYIGSIGQTIAPDQGNGPR
ncbi:hypothetical protein Swit_3508 [Rhizorhabdus wittichii RW1]|uniref:DUF3613 domain-containing protein n=1 Tax=Rhizorhabdus wittichii (strain DSM 6014 / CCUG 31198 / JCM 15750 / NBRC 105917 / EY 4224 / RW1) TaxID=392499 RepID=A0A9J9HDW8_RHIWR|nr:hypothetical protein Swit_3508 [Rhizorhabdus wittichii RW1]